MWLFRITRFHHCPDGNAGQMKVTNKSKARIRACAALLAGNEFCRIYSMPDSDEDMWKLTPPQFVLHVERYGTLILSQGDRAVGRTFHY